MKSKVDRVLSNQTLSSTVSLLTSNIPFPWFLVLGCNREAPIFSFFSFSVQRCLAICSFKYFISCYSRPNNEKIRNLKLMLLGRGLDLMYSSTLDSQINKMKRKSESKVEKCCHDPAAVNLSFSFRTPSTS